MASLPNLRFRAFLRSVAEPVDWALAHLVAWCVPPRILRQKRFFTLWERRGYHITPVHFYEPIPDTRELPKTDDWRTDLVGLRFDTDGQLERLRLWATQFGREYRAWPVGPQPAGEFYISNGHFEAVDAEVLYSIVRENKPARLIEVGSGFSTLVSAAAIRRNAQEGFPCEFVAYEPYPADWLADSGATIEAVRLQDVPPEQFQRLVCGDVLFIDSSHVVATGSDVTYAFLEVLPRLAPGVLVHIHDVFWPRDYPAEWIHGRDLHRFWNEQYVAQAFLAFNDSFEVIWTASYMAEAHPEELREAIPSYQPGINLPGSLWMLRKAPNAQPARPKAEPVRSESTRKGPRIRHCAVDKQR